MYVYIYSNHKGKRNEKKNRAGINFKITHHCTKMSQQDVYIKQGRKKYTQTYKYNI